MKPNGLTHIAAISLTSVTPITFRALAMFGFCYSNYLKDYMYNFFYKPYSWTTTIIFFIVATIFSRVCMWLCKNKQEYFQ